MVKFLEARKEILTVKPVNGFGIFSRKISFFNMIWIALIIIPCLSHVFVFVAQNTPNAMKRPVCMVVCVRKRSVPSSANVKKATKEADVKVR